MVLKRLLGCVDANVLANAVLTYNRIDELRLQYPQGQFEEELTKLWDSYEPSRVAFLLFGSLMDGTLRYGAMLVSHLAILEVVSVIVQEYRSKQLWERHVPFRNWLHQQSKVLLTKQDYRDIRNGLNSFLREFRLAGKLRIYDSYDLSVAHDLVTRYMCDARDAILVATAVKHHSPYFISEDERLKKRLKDYSRTKIVSTQHFLSIHSAEV